MKNIIIIAALAAALTTPVTRCDIGSMACYDAYTSTGLHLIMTDNGTEEPEDDWIVDWEDNIEFEITAE